MRITSLILLVLFLASCGHFKSITASGASIPVNEAKTANRLDSMVMPYRQQLEAEMNVVIAQSDSNFIKGRPNASLNNWAADALYKHQLKGKEESVCAFALLNVGGLRSTINKGDITIGDLFRLMPFDNEVVWVEMPVESLEDIASYLVKSGGEPISGAKLEKNKLILKNLQDTATTFWIITSDYLMNGGDKMTFFEKKRSFHYANVLLRDLFIEEARTEGRLIYSTDERIKLD